MSRCLVMLEVSQKQAYIFESNKVKDNIVNSAVIARCLSPDYIKEVLGSYYTEENLVYSGGGHTILEYCNDSMAEAKDQAKNAVKLLTKTIYTMFDGLMVFAKINEYDEQDSPQNNLKNLTAALERKKSVRSSGFYHGSFGIEAIDVNTLKPQKCQKSANDSFSGGKEEIEKEEYSYAQKSFIPKGYASTYRFEDLGGDKGTSNFIAVVSIDGNGMGKRVDHLYSLLKEEGIDRDWEKVKAKLKEFSDSIDEDYKAAFREMTGEVKESLENGALKGKLKLKSNYFPVRRIITAGDDICFVTEGRIGLECARIYIEKLQQKKNKADGENYSACAGVAIVHQKYPFYRAYELAEELCKSAKSAGAVLSKADDGRNVCSIDWHVEYGEVRSREDIRKDYISDDGSDLTGRPYVITADSNVLAQIGDEKRFETFRNMMDEVLSYGKDYGDGKLKQLRSVMKKGKNETDNYVRFYQLKYKLGKTYRAISDEAKVDLIENGLFDVIELMDTFFFVTEVR